MKLPPWLQRQHDRLRHQRGHALLLAGPAGLGQDPLALALARTWLCDQPGEAGACGLCSSCHAIDVRTHPDLFVLMPETLALALDWPLDPKTQDKIDRKELKPGKFIRVEPTREAIAFTQTTRSRGETKVVLIHPADRLNVESANTLLKTLEEPPGAVRFLLTTEAAHAVLPTIRSRCLTHTLGWPQPDEALAWLGQHTTVAEPEVLLKAAGGSPEAAHAWIEAGLTAQTWRQLPRCVAEGDFGPMADWPATRQMDVLLKLCHDLMAVGAGAGPRYFAIEDLPVPPSMLALNRWYKDLIAAARTMEHPFNPALQQEAWALRARSALALHSEA